MALIKINGIKLNIQVKGQGQPIILIHGIGGDHTQLNFMVGELSRQFKTVTMDCRGHGQSDKPFEYSLEDHVADILAIMDYFKMETTYLLGVSMGSYIAQGVATTAPERIKKLILTVPKSNGMISSVQRLFSEHANEIEGKNMHEAILTLLKYFTYDPELIKQHIDIFETHLTPEEFAAANKALVNFDFRNDLPDITAKTLVISGKYDGLNSLEEGREVAALIPNSTFVEMQYSGHAPAEEEPELYLKIMMDFFLDA